RELLTPVYGWFTEGFDALDFDTAKKLLDEPSALESSFLCDSVLSHGVCIPCALLQEHGIVALKTVEKTTNGERGIERQPDLGFGSCLLQSAEIGQSRSHP